MERCIFTLLCRGEEKHKLPAVNKQGFGVNSRDVTVYIPSVWYRGILDWDRLVENVE